MAHSLVIELPVSVPSGNPGHYKSLWKLANPSGGQFGIGSSGSETFWVDIHVINNSAVVYNFCCRCPNLETYCDHLTKVFPLATHWPYTNIHYYNLYRPATDQQLDFCTWLIGVKYVNGQPYLHSMVSIVWEP